MSSTNHDAKQAHGFSKMREFFHSWKANTAGLKSVYGSADRTELLPRINTAFGSSDESSDDEDSSGDEYGGADSPYVPPDVPRGYLPVLVGFKDKNTLERFVIPIKFLSLAPFQVMLKKAEELYGYNPDGMLTLPIEPETFRYILQCSLAQHLDDVEREDGDGDGDGDGDESRTDDDDSSYGLEDE